MSNRTKLLLLALGAVVVYLWWQSQQEKNKTPPAGNQNLGGKDNTSRDIGNVTGAIGALAGLAGKLVDKFSNNDSGNENFVNGSDSGDDIDDYYTPEGNFTGGAR